MTKWRQVPDKMRHSISWERRQRAVVLSWRVWLSYWRDNRRSYLDNFVPYALEAIRRHPRGAMSERDVRDVINEQFGLTFPASVVASLLNRALKRKLLVREIEHSLRLYTLADGVAAT